MQTTRISRFLDRSTPPHVSTLILATGLAALGMNIFLPSLPRMTEYFQTDYRVMQLSVALYLGMNGLLNVIIGPISDSMGRRPVILWGIALFLLATLACIYAPTAELFLLARMAQAVIAVTMVLSRAAIRDVYSQDEAASRIGYVTMGMAVVPMFGPAIGGVLDALLGWQSNFWLLLILGAVMLWITWRDFGETATKSGKTLVQQFRDYPELFLSPRFWGYTMACALTSGCFFAYLGGAPYVGTEVYGLSSGVFGLFFGSPAVGYFVGNFLTGRYAVRYGVNRMVLWGSLTITAALCVSLALTLAGHDTAVVFFGFMCFVGLGNGLCIPNATAGALSVRPHLAGSAAGLSAAIMLGGGAAMSAIAGMLLKPGVGAAPLIATMLVTAALGIVAITVVILRERQLWL
ncbi:MAG: Bcr/CflA family drug resistance efflux transporter [Pseudooceanicola sp.]|jgi:DHA1 family bicyclomycin/chloramphenicol resistance-like MFS transporter|nr:Bcr/CflA family drug resistance efflux transporter [Pseudooceanicola sp.]